MAESKLLMVSPEYKRSALSLLIRDDIFCKTALPKIPDDWLKDSPELTIIFSTLKEFVAKFGSKPRKKELRKIIEAACIKHKISSEYTSLILSIYDALLTASDFTPEFIRQEIYDAIILHELNTVIEEAPALLSEGNYDQLVQAVFKARHSVKEDSATVGYWSDSDERIIRRKTKVSEVYVPTGIAPLDAVMGGGLPKGRVGLIAAASGRGKSSFLTSFAAHTTGTDYVGAYISYENSLDEVLLRLDANITDMPMPDICAKPDKFHKKLINRILKGKVTELYVYHRPTKSDSISGVRVILERLRGETGVTPDVLYLDYFDLLKMEGNYSKLYEALQENMALLRGLAGEYNMAIWTASQINRGGASKERVSMEDIADSYGKVFALDAMLTIAQTKKDVESNTFRLHVAKGRFFPAGDMWLVRSDFARMKFTVVPFEGAGAYKATAGYDAKVSRVKAKDSWLLPEPGPGAREIYETES